MRRGRRHCDHPKAGHRRSLDESVTVLCPHRRRAVRTTDPASTQVGQSGSSPLSGIDAVIRALNNETTPQRSSSFRPIRFSEPPSLVCWPNTHQIIVPPPLSVQPFPAFALDRCAVASRRPSSPPLLASRTGRGLEMVDNILEPTDGSCELMSHATRPRYNPGISRFPAAQPASTPPLTGRRPDERRPCRRGCWLPRGRARRIGRAGPDAGTDQFSFTDRCSWR